jgi:hypothetical protein
VTVLGRVGRSPAVALWVDPKVHAAEVARFRTRSWSDRATGIAASGLAASEPMVSAEILLPVRDGIVRAAQPVCAGVGRRILLWVRTYSRCMNATTRSLGGSSVLRRLRAVAHDAGDKRASGTMLSPNNGEITPTGN